jgi:hypothetical protein
MRNLAFFPDNDDLVTAWLVVHGRACVAKRHFKLLHAVRGTLANADFPPTNKSLLEMQCSLGFFALAQ